MKCTTTLSFPLNPTRVFAPLKIFLPRQAEREREEGRKEENIFMPLSLLLPTLLPPLLFPRGFFLFPSFSLAFFARGKEKRIKKLFYRTCTCVRFTLQKKGSGEKRGFFFGKKAKASNKSCSLCVRCPNQGKSFWAAVACPFNERPFLSLCREKGNNKLRFLPFCSEQNSRRGRKEIKK